MASTGSLGAELNTPAAKELNEPPECSGASLPYSTSVRETTKKLPHMIIGSRLNGNRLGLKPAAEVGDDPNLFSDRRPFKSLRVETSRRDRDTEPMDRQAPAPTSTVGPRFFETFRRSFQCGKEQELCRSLSPLIFKLQRQVSQRSA